MRYAVITRHRREFPVRLMCRVLDVTPSGYYASLTRPPSWHAVIDDVLMAHVRIAHDASQQTYGAPRIHRELQAEGLPTSTKRVLRASCGRMDDWRALVGARACRRPSRITTSRSRPTGLTGSSP